VSQCSGSRRRVGRAHGDMQEAEDENKQELAVACR
jgi:hypothetical protein